MCAAGAMPVLRHQVPQEMLAPTAEPETGTKKILLLGLSHNKGMRSK
jgi:hypothetical protein